MAKILNMLGITLAFAAGALPAFFIIMAVFMDVPSIMERLLTFAAVLTVYSLIGLMFGFVLPGIAWRWGVWVCIPALIITDWYSIREPWYLVMHFFYFATACTAGCLGANSGAVLAQRRQKSRRSLSKTSR